MRSRERVSLDYFANRRFVKFRHSWGISQIGPSMGVNLAKRAHGPRQPLDRSLHGVVLQNRRAVGNEAITLGFPTANRRRICSFL